MAGTIDTPHAHVERIETPKNTSWLHDPKLKTLLGKDAPLVDTLSNILASAPEERRRVVMVGIQKNTAKAEEYMEEGNSVNMASLLKGIIQESQAEKEKLADNNHSTQETEAEKEARLGKEGITPDVEKNKEGVDEYKKVQERLEAFYAHYPEGKLKATPAYQQALARYQGDPTKASLSAALSPTVRRELQTTLPPAEYTRVFHGLQASAQQLGVEYSVPPAEFIVPWKPVRVEEAIRHSAHDGQEVQVNGTEVRVGDQIWDTSCQPPVRRVEHGGLQVPTDVPYDPWYALEVKKEQLEKSIQNAEKNIEARKKGIEKYKTDIHCETDEELIRKLEEDGEHDLVEKIKKDIEILWQQEEQLAHFREVLRSVEEEIRNRPANYRRNLDRSDEGAYETIRFLGDIGYKELGLTTLDESNPFVMSLRVNYPKHPVDFSQPLTVDDREHIMSVWHKIIFSSAERDQKVVQHFKDGVFTGDSEAMQDILRKRGILQPNGKLDEERLTDIMEEEAGTKGRKASDPIIAQ